jgi:hypothetical protein
MLGEHGVSTRVALTLHKPSTSKPFNERLRAWWRGFFVFGLLVLLSGCAGGAASNRSAWQPWTWFRADAVKAADKTREKQDDNAARQATNSSAIVRGASGYVWATGEALKAATNAEPAVRVAGDMNSRAAVLLPAPEVADVTRMREIVNGLLSTNAQSVAHAQSLLSAKDAELARAQLIAEQLKGDNDRLRAAATRDMADLAARFQGEQATADKWRAHQAKTWLGRILDVLGPAGLVALAVACPAAVPIAGRAFGWFSRVMPSTSLVTGVVDAKGFGNVVAGVEKVRATLRSDPSLAAVAERADDLLRIERAPDDDKLIRAARRRVAARVVR